MRGNPPSARALVALPLTQRCSTNRAGPLRVKCYRFGAYRKIAQCPLRSERARIALSPRNDAQDRCGRLRVGKTFPFQPRSARPCVRPLNASHDRRPYALCGSGPGQNRVDLVIPKPCADHGSRDIPGQTTVENLSLWRDKSKY